MKTNNQILVVGAGLCGSMLALRLAQRGHHVVLHEKRSDMRKSEWVTGRSINLALSDRGLEALNRVGLKEKALELCLPMQGRMIHDVDGNQRMSRYSSRPEDYINSISRSGLNILLINAAEATGRVKIVFNSACIGADLQRNVAFFRQKGSDEPIEEEGLVIFGTDGAGSALRREYMSHTTELLFNYSQDFLRTGYKEISIPPHADGSFRIAGDVLHIWPRKSFMVIALPNLDRSFTVTLFWPFRGPDSFESIDSETSLQSFFQSHFPDLLPHLPDLNQEYFQNPTGTLGTIKCLPWQYKGRFLVMGDAAHAIVPFYGQGMNASFEDVLVLDNIYEEEGSWPQTLKRYESERKKDTDAIADLALDNFLEMQDHVSDPAFIKKRHLEMELERTYPDYYSKYSLVTFRRDLGYHEAMVRGRRQDAFLLELCRSGRSENMTLEQIYEDVMGL